MLQTSYGRVELVTYGKQTGEWLECQLAINGDLAIPFSIHRSDWDNYKTEQERIEMLARQSVGLLESYGDARSQPRIEGAL